MDENEDTILEITGTITVLNGEVEAFIDDLENLFKKYANDDGWYFKFE